MSVCAISHTQRVTPFIGVVGEKPYLGNSACIRKRCLKHLINGGDMRDYEEYRKNPNNENWRRKLAEHQRRFQCHVCGKPSVGPHIYETPGIDPGYRGNRGGGEGRETLVAWDIPGSMGKCLGGWVCNTGFTSSSRFKNRDCAGCGGLVRPNNSWKAPS